MSSSNRGDRLPSISRRFRLRALLFVAAVVFCLSDLRPVDADNVYFNLIQGTPLAQNWTNTALITVDDNWTGVPSINGYRGDGVAAIGSDPQLALVDGSGVLDVLANSINPNTLTTGGVAEFDVIPNPVVALQGSITADAPHIDIRLNTTGCTSASNRVTVSYNLRDVDGSVNDAVQPVALHFRASAAGAYTNVPAGFVADATTGPNLATLVTPVAVSLPATANGVANLHVRIMTVNRVLSDEWVGIDDLQITCAVPSAAAATLAGRVTTANGRGIAKAQVTVSGGSLLTPRSVLTSAFGYYSFDDLQAGQTYIVSVGSKSYTFAVPSRTVQLLDSVSDADFVAEP